MEIKELFKQFCKEEEERNKRINWCFEHIKEGVIYIGNGYDKPLTLIWDFSK